MQNPLDVWMTKENYDARVREAEEYWRQQKLLAEATQGQNRGRRVRLLGRLLSTLGLH